MSTPGTDVSQPIIPPLRDDIVLEDAAPGDRLPFAAVDRALGQKIRLDQRGAMLANALCRPWQPEELLAALAGAGVRIAPQLLVQFVRFLDAHYLLATERAARHVRAVRETDARRGAGPVPITFLPGTMHDCAQCGHSCGGHDVGPIEADRVAEIQRLMPETRFVERRTDDAETNGLYCRMRDDVCTSLRSDKLCAIHAACGLETKPTDCRVFPLAFTSTPEGMVAGVRLECRSYIASKRRGGDLSHRQAELQLLSSRLPSTNEVTPLVRIDESVTLPYSEYLELEAAVVEAAGAHEPVLWRGLLEANATARRLMDAAREADRQAYVFPPLPPGPCGTSAPELLRALADACRTSSRLNGDAGNTLRSARIARVGAAADRLLAGPLAAPASSSDDDELMRDYLQQSLFLKDPLIGPHMRFGMGLLNLAVLLAVALAAGPDGPDGGDLNAALADSLKALRSGPVRSRLHDMADAVAHHLHDRLEQLLDPGEASG